MSEYFSDSPVTEDLPQESLDDDQLFQRIKKHRRLILAIRIAIIAFLLITALTVMAVLTEQNAKRQQELAHVRQIQNEYNRMLLAKESELGINLRPFNANEESAMQAGERDPADVIADIVKECATPEPVLSGKTQDEVVAYYNVFLEQCEDDFLTEVEDLIADARQEWPEAKQSQSSKSNWLTKYTARINKIEARADAQFDGYMDNMRNDLEAIDGSLDDDDISVVSTFYARYNEEKERTIKRFTDEYHLSGV